MQRIWAAVLSVWATIAIVAVLAWAHAPAAPASQPAPVAYVIQGKGASRHLVALPAAAPAAVHATTHTSPVPAGG